MTLHRQLRLAYVVDLPSPRVLHLVDEFARRSAGVEDRVEHVAAFAAMLDASTRKLFTQNLAQLLLALGSEVRLARDLALLLKASDRLLQRVVVAPRAPPRATASATTNVALGPSAGTAPRTTPVRR
jgi:hypothetical protein